MIKYPNGEPPILSNDNKKKMTSKARANQGMDLEGDVQKSCDYYAREGIASITKRPTPIKIVSIDNSQKSESMITQAKFMRKSETDFVGIYRGKYIDFECKKTTLKSLAYTMIEEHQFTHMMEIEKYGGISFFLIHMAYYDRIFLVDSRILTKRYREKDHSAMDIDFFLTNAVEVYKTYVPRIDFLKAVDRIYFNSLFNKETPDK